MDRRLPQQHQQLPSDLRHRRIFSSPVGSPALAPSPPSTPPAQTSTSTARSTGHLRHSQSLDTGSLRPRQRPSSTSTQPRGLTGSTPSRTRSTPSKMPFLSTITSFFSPTNPNPNSASSSSRLASKRATMNSTFDAFSLPTTSHAMSGSMHEVPSALESNDSPGPSRRSSYAYPPPAEAYRPAMAYFPPLSHTFHRLRNALADSFPELLETLNPPADPILLAQFEAELGCPLPPPVRDSFLIADGQDQEAANNLGSGGLFFGLYMLPLDQVIDEWTFWRQAEFDPDSGQNPSVLATMASIPPNWVKPQYACRGWLPLISDRSGNYIGVDLDPGQGGSWGQVIVFGRDFDRKCVMWKGEGDGGWGKWLAAFTDELESGEGWEAEKNSSSDEEDDIGYTSYSGGGSYGESGKGLRLAGEYKGWAVLEAWWDRSVRKWEEMGLGMDVEAIERGLAEARRLAGLGSEAKGKEREEAMGMRMGDTSAQVQIPVMGSPAMQAPPTPTPKDSDSLLPPSSPDVSASTIPKIRHPPPSPIRVITPVSSTDHPLKSADLLSPPDNKAPRQQPKRRSRAPAPTPIDLPTRADMQAMSAISRAESSGLRGGWIMNTDTSSSSAHRRSQASSSMPSSSTRNGSGGHEMAYRQSLDTDMVDIDLEGGKGDSFGSPRMSSEDLAAHHREERLALAPLEHRRASPVTSPHQSRPTSPSPLSIETTPFDYDSTPRATPREEHHHIAVPAPSSFAATSPIRPPPRLGSHSDRGMRATTPDGEGKDKEVIRGDSRRELALRDRPRAERESSVISVDSQEGLLGSSGTSSRQNSPPPFISPATSPSPVFSNVPAPAPLVEDHTSPTTKSFPSTTDSASADALRAPVQGSRHKPTGSIVAARRKALEDAMGGLEVGSKK